MSMTPSKPPTHPSTYRGRLTPTRGKLHVVRHLRDDHREVLHRYFRRLPDAERFAQRLAAQGKDAAIFTTSTEWRPVA